MTAPNDLPLKVFISYSRKDEAFAQELKAGLEVAGFTSIIDRQDIAPGEGWEGRLDRLIETADTMVFVLSPDSVASPRCGKEVESAVTLRKRLVPIVWRSVPESDVPEALKRINYIYFDKPHIFGPSLVALAQALRTDLAWVREHSRYSEAAIRWDSQKRMEALLLRGEVLAAAKQWLEAQPKSAPEATLLTRELIAASETAEAARNNAERQRLEEIALAQAQRAEALDAEGQALAHADEARRGRALALRVGFCVAAVLAVTATVFAGYASIQKRAADESADTAIAERGRAQKAQSVAEEKTREAEREAAARKLALARALETQKRVSGLLQQLLSDGMQPGGHYSLSHVWPSNTSLKVCFIGGSPQLRQKVAQVAREWTYYGNLDFDFGLPPELRSCDKRPSVGDPAREKVFVRVSLDRNRGNWAFIGTQVHSYTSDDQPTMNLAIEASISEADLRMTVLHEFGHVLGFGHAFQGSDSTCEDEFDWAYIYAHFAKPPQHWSKAQVDLNMRASKMGKNKVGSGGVFDVRSIMNYRFPEPFFKRGRESPCFTSTQATDLSLADKLAVFAIYGRSEPKESPSAPK
ncbi:TIR domain-containing protein [Variovorax sp. J22R115]|uniref:TIR domain-containing protein n=1 Tax=Variovorax sp. J22R115 TaxID=3053509 RepID=UPI0025762995|nr:TIR domain-containing protein [Variovorax sp. J22R115]MDM0053792.1 TIR domain-containing protein [Variovorax sp. J22R115]